MKLRDAILEQHSKKQCDLIVEWVGSSQKRFDQLFLHFINDEPLVMQRAAWAVGCCTERYPHFINNHMEELLGNLNKEHHTSIPRNTVRLLQFADIPEEYEGLVMDQCIHYISSSTEAVAVKAFSFAVLGRLAKRYPEIIPEIKLVIEQRLPHETAAYISRAKRFLKQAGK
jgi:hypothetical protein